MINALTEKKQFGLGWNPVVPLFTRFPVAKPFASLLTDWQEIQMGSIPKFDLASKLNIAAVCASLAFIGAIVAGLF
jgi:hypothetical protein